MLAAGTAGFGGGIGGVNIIKEFSLRWAESAESAESVLDELLNVTALAQYGGYTQGVTLAAYLGAKTGLGIFGAVLGVAAFILPSVAIVAIILKIGEKLYKNSVFRYSVNYINLMAAGLICMIVWNYTIKLFGIDLIYPLIAALACFVNIYFKVSPVFIILGGAFIGVIWRA
jgi:chromate transport protein ChrA